MGVKGLWSLLDEGACVRWDARDEEDGRDLLIVDYSAVEHMVVERGLPHALLELRTVCKHEEHARCLRAWLSAWLELGFDLMLVLDGSPRICHKEASIARKLRKQKARPDDRVGRPPLFGAVSASVLARLRAEWPGERLRAFEAEKDADVLLTSLFRRERARVAAVLTSDSDFFVYRVERIVNVRDTAALLDGGADRPLAFRMYGAAGSVGRTVLAQAKAQAKKMRPELAYQQAGLAGAKALLDEFPAGDVGCTLLEDIAACLGNDSSKLVRDATAGRSASPWLVIRHLLAKAAVQRGWRDDAGRARQKLFADLGLDGVLRRWADYCGARDEYARVTRVEDLLVRPEPFAERLASGGGRESSESRAFLAALCCEQPLGKQQWLPRVVRKWPGCGLGSMPRLGTEARVHAALLPLRALVARVVCERLAPPPAGWTVHELVKDAGGGLSGCVALHRPSGGEVVPEGCFVPVAGLAVVATCSSAAPPAEPSAIRSTPPSLRWRASPWGRARCARRRRGRRIGRRSRTGTSCPT